MTLIGFYRDEHQGLVGRAEDRLPLLADQPRRPGELADLVAHYLTGGRVLGKALGWGRDIFDPDLRTNLDDLTDGEWVWPGHALHYCENYGIVPPNEDFLNKVRALNGQCRWPTDDEIRALDEELYAGTSDPGESIFRSDLPAT